MNDIYRLNIALIGGSHVGKSTFLNAIMAHQYCDTESERTTMVPQCYIFNANNSIVNYGKPFVCANKPKNVCEPIYHYIENSCDLVDTSQLDSNIIITVYDVPGIDGNDNGCNDVYLKWIRENIQCMDIVIFMTDITSGLSKNYEINLLKFLFELMTKYNFNIINAINKCDDIVYSNSDDDLIFNNITQACTYSKSNTVLINIANSFGFQLSDNMQSNRFTPFIPISSLNCFTCKCAVNSIDTKHTINDIHAKILNTGYPIIQRIATRVIVQNQYNFIKNHIKNKIKMLATCSIAININRYITILSEITNHLNYLTTKTNHELYNDFWICVRGAVGDYINTILLINVNIIKKRQLIHINEFDELHSKMFSHCFDFESLKEICACIHDYPQQFFTECSKKLIGKLCVIYDQLLLVEYNNCHHLSCENICIYLQLVYRYDITRYDEYCEKFLKIHCTNKNTIFNDSYENSLLQLTSIILKHTSNYSIMISYIFNLLLNKQMYLQSKIQFDSYLHYLLEIKTLVKLLMCNCHDNYAHLKLKKFYEITKHNICTCLNNDFILCLKTELDYDKASKCLLSNIDSANIVSTALERVVFESLSKAIEL